MSTATLRPSVHASQRSARRRPARLTLTVWWRGTELDRRLAAGEDPRADEMLALRARRLTSARSRRRMADGLARALRSARNGSPSFAAAVRPRSAEVLEASTAIASIERGLRAPGPVTAQGVALVRLLLIDGNGLLYRPSGPGALNSRFRDIAAALRGARAGQ